MRVAELHRLTIKKQIEKLQHGNYENKRNTTRPIIFRSDSKGRSLLPFINYRNRMDLIFRGGAKLTDNFLQFYTLRKIANSVRPVVILWFGSCELTVKRGKFIHLAENIETKLASVIDSYLIYKQQVLEANKESKIIFIECPFQSLIIWNFLKGHPTPGVFKEDQKILEQYISKLNNKIKEINGNQVIPHIAQNFGFCVKKKKRSPIYLKNYSLLTDGVHPGKLLSKLWFLRFMRMLSFA